MCYVLGMKLVFQSCRPSSSMGRARNYSKNLKMFHLVHIATNMEPLQQVEQKKIALKDRD